MKIPWKKEYTGEKQKLKRGVTSRDGSLRREQYKSCRETAEERVKT